MATQLFELEVDATQIVLAAHVYERAGAEAPMIISRALNHTGDKGYTQVKRTLAQETGARAKDIADALKKNKATPKRLAYEIVARGAALSLKAFGARQTAKGVSAAPWRKRRVFPHTFGPKIAKLGGHVFRRVGKARLPLKKLYGPSVPREMIRGASAEALSRVMASDLAPRILHELDRWLGGAGGAAAGQPGTHEYGWRRRGRRGG